METLVCLDTLEQTTRCPCNFQCQEPSGEPRCSPSRMVAGKLLRVHTASLGERFCPCLINHGGDHFCTCPTRTEIFKRQGV
jgi:hypothetical protein